MILDAERQKELDHAWIESLLHEALNRDTQGDADRIHTLFATPDFDLRELGASSRSLRSSLARWIPIAIAASLLIVFGLWSLLSNPNQRAYAAIERSLKATPLAREYSVRIVANSLTKTAVPSTAQLFIDSADRFVVHRQGWVVGDVWFGNDGSNYWVVPRLGPAVLGSERILGNWLAKKDATTPYLHIKTILKRMAKEYRLTMLPDTALASGDERADVVCERVRGECKEQISTPNHSLLPFAIELWADKKTGIAHRVVLTWNRQPTQIGPLEWTIDLKGFPSLADDWFTPLGHISADQRILAIGQEAELESLPKSND